MGYFANGTEGMMYEERYCSKCVHEEGCAVWAMHIIHNYDECNNPESLLHKLIPKLSDGGNGECTMFWKRTGEAEEEKRPHPDVVRRKLQLLSEAEERKRLDTNPKLQSGS